MATVFLQVVGTAIGGAAGGALGAALGRVAGAYAGSAIDQKLFSKDRVIEGPRLEDTRIQTSTSGKAIPKIYGNNRVAGEIIWATRFEEITSTTRSGGKGGGAPATTSATYTYLANFAIGICEGPVAGVRRIWVDGKEMDQTRIEFRFYNGSESQQPDPLIEAKQGSGNAPAYRGTAYAVFEGFSLQEYGNRIPQFSFEILRPVSDLTTSIRTITVIPGSTEYGYDTIEIEGGDDLGNFQIHNRNNTIADTDWKASIDELQSVCPNLEKVALVVTWFGNDLRADNCVLRPGVTDRIGPAWSVAGNERHEAHLISKHKDKAAFGGTPDDASVLRAIADLKSRGLKVVLYPFIMMDIPEDNQLPYLGAAGPQPAFPWRGEISCSPAIGVSGSADQTALARSQIDSFLADNAGNYRSLILHYAILGTQAGGIDGFLIGSEMRGLTQVRDEDGKFPFVEGLIDLAADVKQMLGEQCVVTYGADWSEYFGFHPQDGSNDLIFNLDPLWASENMDAVGIDNYMPLSDWREAGDPGRPDVFSPYDINYLKQGIAGGEGYDWYYSSDSDRVDGIRTQITDGLGEPWVWRNKDLASWWSLPHHERINGVRSSNQTEWQPKSKPIIMTELGCPSVDLGGNQPNVFIDPKSSQSFFPRFSRGARQDLAQQRFLKAHFDYWSPASKNFDSSKNPASDQYSGRMISTKDISPWAWDSRPFPWFPQQLDIWSDGTNWQTGHWLNGRITGCPVDELIVRILSDYGYHNVVCHVDGFIDGYIVPDAVSARAAISPLLELFNIQVIEQGDKLVFQDAGYSSRAMLAASELVQENDTPKIVSSRDGELELPAQALVSHSSMLADYHQSASESRRLEGGSKRQIIMQVPVVMPEETAVALADLRLRESWVGRETRRVSVSPSQMSLGIGDVIDDETGSWLVENAEIGVSTELSLKRVPSHRQFNAPRVHVKASDVKASSFGKPLAILMDLPLLGDANQNKFHGHIAVHADPWAQNYALLSSPNSNGFELRAPVNQHATIGVLQEPLVSGPAGIWDRKNTLLVKLLANSFASAERLPVLNGENALAVESVNGEYEVLQFTNAELQPDGSWRLFQLLRAQLGTSLAAEAGAIVGAKVVLLDNAVTSFALGSSNIGLELNWKTGPTIDPIGAKTYIEQSFTFRGISHRMFEPAHLRFVKTSGGDHNFTWLRRGRVNSDSWETVEIPLDAGSELYSIRVIAGDESILREWQVAQPQTEYTLSDRELDMGDPNASYRIEVAQIGDDGRPGLFGKLEIPA